MDISLQTRSMAPTRFRQSVVCSAVEALEGRRLYAFSPSPVEQYAVELINRARANPNAEAQRYSGFQDSRNNVYDGNLNEGLPAGTITANAKQPVAINPQLTLAARGHSEWMVANSTFSHGGAGGNTPGQRISAQGYIYGNPENWGENIAINWNSAAINATTTAYDQQRNLFTDMTEDGSNGGAVRGHRVNMMDAARNEIGVGFAAGPYNLPGYPGINALASTQDTATNGRLFLTGVAYTDGVAHDAFYTPGEGLSGIVITATRTTDNAVFTTSTWASGGYSMELPAGTYNVRGVGSGLTSNVYYNNITISGENVKRDFVTGQTSDPGPTPPIFARIRSRTLVLTGTDGNDVIGVFVDADTNRYIAGMGDQRRTYAAELIDAVAIKAGDGNDRVVIGPGVAHAYVEGGYGKDTLIGGDGEDTLYGNAGIDRIEGNGGNDFIVGENGHDLIYGGAGNDRIYGGFGNDTIDAGPGNDRIFGGVGDDYIIGGKGRDWFNGELGADTLHGGHHTDTAVFDEDDTRILIEVLV